MALKHYFGFLKKNRVKNISVAYFPLKNPAHLKPQRTGSCFHRWKGRFLCRLRPSSWQAARRATNIWWKQFWASSIIRIVYWLLMSKAISAVWNSLRLLIVQKRFQRMLFISSPTWATILRLSNSTLRPFDNNLEWEPNLIWKGTEMNSGVRASMNMLEESSLSTNSTCFHFICEERTKLCNRNSKIGSFQFSRFTSKYRGQRKTKARKFLYIYLCELRLASNQNASKFSTVFATGIMCAISERSPSKVAQKLLYFTNFCPLEYGKSFRNVKHLKKSWKNQPCSHRTPALSSGQLQNRRLCCRVHWPAKQYPLHGWRDHLRMESSPHCFSNIEMGWVWAETRNAHPTNPNKWCLIW